MCIYSGTLLPNPIRVCIISQWRTASTVWVSWFVRLFAAIRSQAMPVRSTIIGRGTALVTQVHKRAPEARERQENGATNYKPDEVRNCTGVTVLCAVSYKRAPWYSRLTAPARMYQSTSRLAYYVYVDSYLRTSPAGFLEVLTFFYCIHQKLITANNFITTCYPIPSIDLFWLYYSGQKGYWNVSLIPWISPSRW